MSRALDKDVATRLGNGDHTEAYNQISSALQVQPEGHGLLEIEILGRSHPVPPELHLLRDGNAIAIPKLSLVRAFLVARERLLQYVTQPSTPSADDDYKTGMSGATAAMLLMDPEHLTAANTRKRRILWCLESHSPDRFREMMQEELWLVDSLLTSRLHRHTKSPTLWSHRRWLVQTCETSGIQVDVLGGIVDVVMVAGERHPRNYYAWCHARWLLATTGTNSRDGTDGTDFDKVLEAVKDWSFRHHTDTSGWSFLWFLMCSEAGASKQVCLSTFIEAVKLSESLRWTNESVWLFFRTVAASGLVGTAGDERLRSAVHLLGENLAVGSLEQQVLQRAQDWVASHRVADTRAT